MPLAVDTKKSLRVKIAILAAAAMVLAVILSIVVSGSHLTAIWQSEPEPLAKNSTAIKRLEEAFKNNPFTVAITGVLLTMVVLFCGGIIVYGYYLNKED